VAAISRRIVTATLPAAALDHLGSSSTTGAREVDAGGGADLEKGPLGFANGDHRGHRDAGRIDAVGAARHEDLALKEIRGARNVLDVEAVGSASSGRQRLQRSVRGLDCGGGRRVGEQLDPHADAARLDDAPDQTAGTEPGVSSEP
jgi:hypothetical protein